MDSQSSMKSRNGLDTVPSPAPARRRERLSIRALVATALSCAVLFGLNARYPDLMYKGLARWNEPSHAHTKETQHTWSEITSSSDLKFVNCFGRYQCAKLSLPLDYFNGTYAARTVDIAITKLPAQVPIDDPRYGGPILVNPGGPGGSGVGFVHVLGGLLQGMVDPAARPWDAPDDAKYYDILGFDPRGIGFSEPMAACMPTYASAWSWRLREGEEGILGSSDAALGRLWSMSHAWGSSCLQTIESEQDPSIMQYMTTASVARDMLEIVKKHADYVAEELGFYDTVETASKVHAHPTITDPDKAMLNYWGFSYGTFLGSTFASMFPDRVGRVLLDGVVSSHDYTHALGDGSLVDAEKVVQLFYSWCLNSKTQECPLNRDKTTMAEIEEYTQYIIKSIYHKPIMLPSRNGPEVFTYSDLKGILFSSNYNPYPSFPFIAELLHEIATGKGYFLEFMRMGLLGHVYTCPLNGTRSPAPLSQDATIAILCSDGLDQSHVDITKFTQYWDLLESISPASGAIWATLKMRCAAWKIKAVHKYSGKYGGNTSNPILFISNTADPVTPLRSGRLMHTKFPNSAILVSDHAGHCTLSGPNHCTLSHIQSYFQNGTLPKENTLCVPPVSPYSLNSTDPKSPFYDPSLGGMNIVYKEVGQMDDWKANLMDCGRRAQRLVARHGLLGLDLGVVSERVKRMMKAGISG